MGTFRIFLSVFFEFHRKFVSLQLITKMEKTITISIGEHGYTAFSASVPLDFGAVPDCEEG